MQKLIRTISCGLLVASLLTPGFASAAGGFLPYGDISKHWAKQSIIRGVQAGLFAAGDKTPLFYPNRNMTRAEFVVLMDRLYDGGQYQIYPLTFLSEHGEWGKGDGFEEPFLPYKDVDRLTWMYGPILRVSFLMDRLYGPGSIQQVFPGTDMHPGQPITHEEAAKIMLMYTMGSDSQRAWEEVSEWKWIEGEKTDLLKRGEAAVAADRLMNYLAQDTILPLLNYDGQKFPMVPEIQDLFPLFVTYAEQKTADEQTYINAVDAIINHQDTDDTYAGLKKLEQASFSNQIGVHFYLSWDPATPLSDNLEEAFKAIDAYFQDKIILPDTLRLLSANVYDIALQMGAADPRQYSKVLERMAAYEKKLEQGSEEWESLAIYMGAMEVKSGQMNEALQRYQLFASRNPEALLNTAYYLLQEERVQEAEEMVAKLKPAASNTRMTQLSKLLGQELTSLKEQSSIAKHLSFTLRHLDTAPSYKVQGESILSGYLFKYTQEVDQRKQISHTSGFYQSPKQLVSDKLDSYGDSKNQIQYTLSPDRKTWDKQSTSNLDFLHEWVETKSVDERIWDLHARYFKQSYGRFDIITEWIPGSVLEEKAGQLSLGKGRIKNVPLYMNKYYIDRESDQLVQHMWRYEEIYASKEYVAYSGTDNYDLAAKIKFAIPDDVRKGVTP